MRDLKVMFLFEALSHYSVHWLNRLHATPGLSVHEVVPANSDIFHKEGVYESANDVTYNLYRLHQQDAGGGHFRFIDGLALVGRIRPDILVVTPPYLRWVRRNPAMRLLLWGLGAKVMLKSIPFRMRSRDEVRNELIAEMRTGLAHSSPRIAGMLKRVRRFSKLCGTIANVGLGIPLQGLRIARARLHIWNVLHEQGSFWRFPAAHLNYVEAGRGIAASYGVAPSRVFVTANSPDTERLLLCRERLQAAGIVRAPHRLIHVGRLVKWKRVDMLIRAVAALKGRFPDVDLLVIGAGPMDVPWKALANELGVAERVRWLGPIYDEDALGRHYHTAAVYVLAGMGGISINEAMCFGLPVVCSVCDGTEKNLVRNGENGFLFIEGNEDDLVAKITDVMASPERCHSMGERSLAIIRNEINVHTVVARYVDAFAKVSGRALPRRLDKMPENRR